MVERNGDRSSISHPYLDSAIFSTVQNETGLSYYGERILRTFFRTCSDMKFELHSFAPLSTCDNNPDMYIGLQFVCCPAGKIFLLLRQ